MGAPPECVADALFKASLRPATSYILTRQQVLDILEALDMLIKERDTTPAPMTWHEDWDCTDLATLMQRPSVVVEKW